MRFYARNGSHFIHADEDCNALDNLEYMEITLGKQYNTISNYVIVFMINLI